MNMCIHPDQNEWSDEWPTEPGTYWFYGWDWGDFNREPELHYVRVKRISNGVAHITDGNFVLKGDKWYGKWQIADLPELPELERP